MCDMFCFWAFTVQNQNYEAVFATINFMKALLIHCSYYFSNGIEDQSKGETYSFFRNISFDII